MPDKVTISHRGAKYEIGRGKRCYGIWVNGAPPSDPIDRWPETREGWEQAWARFTAIETPGTIAAVTPRRAAFALPRMRQSTAAGAARGGGPVGLLAGAGLLGLGVLLGVIGLFPAYAGSRSLAAQADQLVPHLLYLLTWAVTGAGVLLGVRGRPARPGRPGRPGPPGAARTWALLGTGLSAVTFGLLFADLGQVISGGASLLGTGLLLSMLGWLACAAGSVIALIASPGTAAPRTAAPGTADPRTAAPGPSFGSPASVRGYAVGGGLSRPRVADAGPVALLLLAAAGAVATFVPSWDSYTLTQTATGAAQTVTAGNAFANPAPVIAGNVAVMVAVVGVAVLSALWRPARQGAVLLAGAIVPLVAQAISALIQAGEPATPAMFGISQSQAQAAGLTISSGLTPIFWVYCVFVISLLISCAWMLTGPHYQSMPATPWPPAPGPGRPAQNAAGEAGDSGAEAGYSGAEAGDSGPVAGDNAGNAANPAGDSDGGGEGREESTYA